MVLAYGLRRYECAVTVPVTRIEANWAGLRTFAPDRTPVVGADPVSEGFLWLAGQGGYSIQTAPALAEVTAARWELFEMRLEPCKFPRVFEQAA